MKNLMKNHRVSIMIITTKDIKFSNKYFSIFSHQVKTFDGLLMERLYQMVFGIANILDGLISMLTLGYISTGVTEYICVYKIKYIMYKRKIKNGLK